MKAAHRDDTSTAYLASEVLSTNDAVDAIVLAGQGDRPAEARHVEAPLFGRVLVREDAVSDHQVLAVQVPRRAELQPLQHQRVPDPDHSTSSAAAWTLMNHPVKEL